MRRLLPVILFFLAALSCGEPVERVDPDLAERQERLERVEKMIARFAGGTVAQAQAALSDQDPWVRSRAARRLAELGELSSPAVPQLIRLLADEETRVRIAACMALKETKDERALEPLTRLLTDKVRKVRLWAWKAIVKFGEPAIPGLVEHLGTSSPLKQQHYVDEIGKPHSIRLALVERMPDFGKDAVPHMVEALKSEDLQVRINAVRILGGIGAAAKEAIPNLVSALEEEDIQVQEFAAEALGQIGDLDPRVIPALEKAKKDPEKKVARKAQQALGEIQKKKNKSKSSKRGKGKGKGKGSKGRRRAQSAAPILPPIAGGH